MRFSIVIFLSILLPSMSNAQWAGNVTDEDSQNQFKRWSYFQEANNGGMNTNEYSVTFLAPSLVKKWVNYEKDEYSKERIQRLYKTITEKGYSVYVIGVKVAHRATLDIAPVEKNIVLNIAEQSPKDYKPTAYSNNLNRTLMGINSNTYYGVVAYDTPPDMFAFQNLTLNATWTLYRNNTFQQATESGPHHLQFAFMPNGVPRAVEQPRASYRYFDIANIIDILSVGLQIISLIR